MKMEIEQRYKRSLSPIPHKYWLKTHSRNTGHQLCSSPKCFFQNNCSCRPSPGNRLQGAANVVSLSRFWINTHFTWKAEAPWDIIVSCASPTEWRKRIRLQPNGQTIVKDVKKEWELVKWEKRQHNKCNVLPVERHSGLALAVIGN